MKRKTWLIVSALTVIGFVWGFVGCDDDDENKGSTYYSFSIEYPSGLFDIGGWAIVQTADGSRVLRAAAPEPETTVVFDSLSTNVVTYTNINMIDAEPRNYWIASFQGVDVEDWTFGEDFNPPSVGQARVTFEFEPQDTSRRLYAKVSGNGQGSYIVDEIPAGIGMWQTVLSVSRPESDGSIAILGRLYDFNHNLPYLAGYLYGQDFVTGDTNSYHVTMDAELDRPVISFSRPVHNVQIGCAREPYYQSYQLYGWSGDETHEVTVEIPSGFPVQKYLITAYSQSEETSYTLNQNCSAIPSSVDFPETSFDITDHPEAVKVDDIHITGASDLITALWKAEYSGLNGWTEILWFVWCDASVASITPPALPDSIREELELELAEFELYEVFVTNCDGYDGIRGFAHTMFADETPEYYTF
ncbi:hypothetical protein KKC97_01300, partial [bacterium]|nr:hypothetical protein [bacterium]